VIASISEDIHVKMSAYEPTHEQQLADLEDSCSLLLRMRRSLLSFGEIDEVDRVTAVAECIEKLRIVYERSKLLLETLVIETVG